MEKNFEDKCLISNENDYKCHHPINIIGNIHQDDIHVLKITEKNELITGSKDGSIKLWDIKGSLIRILRNNENHFSFLKNMLMFKKKFENNYVEKIFQLVNLFMSNSKNMFRNYSCIEIEKLLLDN